MPLGLWVGVVSQVIPVIGTYLACALPLMVALGSEGAVRSAFVVLVVVTVSTGPPEGASLDGESGPDRHHELEGAGGGVGLVGEVPVQEAGDREHPEEVEADGGPDGDGAGADPDDGEAGQMEQDEGDGAGPVDLLGGVL